MGPTEQCNFSRDPSAPNFYTHSCINEIILDEMSYECDYDPNFAER